METKCKVYDYQPMNATEFFLNEIARNTEEMVELLKKLVPVEEVKPVAKVVEKVVEKPVVEEVKPVAKPVARKRTKKE